MKSYNVDIVDVVIEIWELCLFILVNEMLIVCLVGKVKLIILVCLYCLKSYWEGNLVWEFNWSGSKWDVWIIFFFEDLIRGYSCICVSRVYCID